MSTHHHAYLLVGEREEVLGHLDKILCELGVKKEGNPDFFLYEEVGIKDARAIGERAIVKSFGEKKVFVILGDLTHEAQNALLKTVEEPIPDTHFFISVREEGRIIPTLRSRMQIVTVGGDAGGDRAGKFLKSSIKDRLSFAKKFSDEEASIDTFLDELLLELKKSENTKELKNVYKLRHYAGDKSVSRRLILEHLAAVL
jgi:hypothetical protein